MKLQQLIEFNSPSRATDMMWIQYFLPILSSAGKDLDAETLAKYSYMSVADAEKIIKWGTNKKKKTITTYTPSGGGDASTKLILNALEDFYKNKKTDRPTLIQDFGWSPEEFDKAFNSNPELIVNTLSKLLMSNKVAIGPNSIKSALTREIPEQEKGNKSKEERMQEIRDVITSLNAGIGELTAEEIARHMNIDSRQVNKVLEDPKMRDMYYFLKHER